MANSERLASQLSGAGLHHIGLLCGDEGSAKIRAQLIALRGAPISDAGCLADSAYGIVRAMKSLRRFVRTRSFGGVVAAGLAYALAIQAVLASVGFGMSAAAASGPSGFVICGLVAAPSAAAPATGDHQKPASAPQCPFCFVAAQSAGQLATLGAAPARPAYLGLRVADAFSGQCGGASFVPQFPRMTGDPRGPPGFSV